MNNNRITVLKKNSHFAYKSSSFEKFYQKSLKFLSYRPRSEWEIKSYLKKKLKKFPQKKASKVIEKVIKNLRRENLLNDKEFAAWWFEQRAAFNPRGKSALMAELRAKGIKRQIIEKTISKLPEEKLAKEVIERKIKIYKNLPYLKLKQKLNGFLFRRGFSSQVVKKVVDEYLQKE